MIRGNISIAFFFLHNIMATAMCNIKNDNKKSPKMLDYMSVCVCACEICDLVPLAKAGATVGTPSLTQGEAEEDTEGEEEDGTQDPQASEVILQDPNSAGRAASHHHYRGLDDGVTPSVGLLGYGRAHLGRWVSLDVGVRVGRRGRRRDGPIALLRRRAVLISPRDGVVGGGSVLEKGFAVHHLALRAASCPLPST